MCSFSLNIARQKLGNPSFILYTRVRTQALGKFICESLKMCRADVLVGKGAVNWTTPSRTRVGRGGEFQVTLAPACPSRRKHIVPLAVLPPKPCLALSLLPGLLLHAQAALCVPPGWQHGDSFVFISELVGWWIPWAAQKAHSRVRCCSVPGRGSHAPSMWQLPTNSCSNSECT